MARRRSLKERLGDVSRIAKVVVENPTATWSELDTLLGVSRTYKRVGKKARAKGIKIGDPLPENVSPTQIFLRYMRDKFAEGGSIPRPAMFAPINELFETISNNSGTGENVDYVKEAQALQDILSAAKSVEKSAD